MKDKNFQYYLSKFFKDEMSSRKGCSKQTISSYADTFKLFLMFMKDNKNINPESIELDDLTRDNIHDFLNWLEDVRKVKITSRNVRLAAIHSFIRYLQGEDPTLIFEYQKILSIKKKKASSKEVMWLTKEQLLKILESPDSKSREGLRDKTLLTVLYDAGLRADELINLKLSNIIFLPQSIIKVTGKGNKTRNIPLLGNTVNLLKKYIKEFDIENKQFSSLEFLFFNRSKSKLTRAGLSYIIKKYVNIANKSGANITINVHPHVFRHTKAVHLLESGVELIYIRDFLGHSSINTTEIYAKVCNSNKLKALEKAYEDIVEINEDDWTINKDLMSYLTALTRR